MASPNVEATVTDMVDDDIVQDSESEEESDGGATECEYCFTPMDGRIGETVECPNCELGFKTIRRTRLDESSEASSATVGDLLTLEVIATPQVVDHADPSPQAMIVIATASDGHADPPKPDNETKDRCS